MNMEAWVGVLYVVRYAHKASLISYQSLFKRSTTFLNKLQSVLLKSLARPLAGVLYMEDLYCLNSNFSR